MKKIIKYVSILLCLILCVSAVSSCSAQTLMSYEDKTISVNMYEFLLSRMKGTLSYYGYDVNSESFWMTVISSDGTTWEDYFKETVKKQALNYIVADRLFDENGLKLTDAQIKIIDDKLDGYVKKAGSKTLLNEQLKQYGANYDILREVYIIEAKIQVLKEHLYGKNGEKITIDTKEQYFNDNYVAFKQIFLATYDYIIDTDRFGDTVYYTDDKYTAIAYDKKNGVTKTDEFGKTVKDVLGNTEYYTADGKIAYDKANGVIGYLTNSDGDKVIENVSSEKKSEIYDNAKKYSTVCNGNVALFEEYIKLYGEGESDGVIYLYASEGYYAAQNDAVAYFDDMAEKLKGLDVGECAVYESSYGYHILSRYDNEDGAYDNEENEEFFESFYEELIALLMDEMCAEYHDDVEIDEELLDSIPKMYEIGSNILY